MKMQYAAYQANFHDENRPLGLRVYLLILITLIAFEILNLSLQNHAPLCELSESDKAHAGELVRHHFHP